MTKINDRLTHLVQHGAWDPYQGIRLTKPLMLVHKHKPDGLQAVIEMFVNQREVTRVAITSFKNEVIPDE